MFEKALGRAALLSEQAIVVADAAHGVQLERVLGKADIKTKLLLEQTPQNTAAAALVGALGALEYNEDALICVMPCDHVIMDEQAFAKQVGAATEYAQAGSIVLFGIAPSVSAQYGFIIRTPLMIGEGEFYPVESFREKPSIKHAQSLIETGRSYINSGIFLLQAKKLITLMQQLQPALYEQVKQAYDGRKGTCIAPYGLAAKDALPLDKAVIEKAGSLVVAPACFDWADVGSLEVLRDVSAQNEDFCPKIRLNLAQSGILETA